MEKKQANQTNILVTYRDQKSDDQFSTCTVTYSATPVDKMDNAPLPSSCSLILRFSPTRVQWFCYTNPSSGHSLDVRDIAKCSPISFCQCSAVSWPLFRWSDILFLFVISV